MAIFRKVKPLLIGFFVGLCMTILIFGRSQQEILNTSETGRLIIGHRISAQNSGIYPADGFKRQGKIVIATVACANRTDTPIYEETAVMMKSVLLSAKMHMVATVEFHIFLEHKTTSQMFVDKLQEFGCPYEDMEVKVYFHAAIPTVPERYREHMIYHKRFRCGYVRTFFPSALPNVDSVLYLDTDIIVTGDVTRLWSLLKMMNSQQMVAIGRNNEPGDTNYKEMDKRLFGDIPHVPPKGLNNGVIAMNLTRLRDFDWENKFTRLYDVYSKSVNLTVQRVMNMLLFYNPGLLLTIPCELHFIHTHCTKGPTCANVKTDPVGIHVLHGANNTFERKGIFRAVFTGYQSFNMTNGDFYSDLVEPIRQSYISNPNSTSQCYGYLNHNLFKNVK